MQTVEYRRFIRHPLCLPLSFTIIKEKKTAKTEDEERSSTINVSLGGLLFPSKRKVAAGEAIVIKMPFEAKVFNIRAKVVRCLKSDESNLFEIAVSFSRPQEAFKVKMVEQIYLIAEYRDLLRVQTGKEVTLEEASRKWIKKYSERFSRLYW